MFGSPETQARVTAYSCIGCSLHKGSLAKGTSGGENPAHVPLTKPSAHGDLPAQRGRLLLIFTKTPCEPCPSCFLPLCDLGQGHLPL